MTLSVRNNCFKTGIGLSALSLIVAVSAAFVVMPAYPEASGEAARRSLGIFQGLLKALSPSAPYVPFVSMLGSVVYSLISIILIYYFFEKTQSQEILFFSLFVISFAAESIRIIIPLKIVYALPTVYCAAASRALIFGRHFGLFSLFAAGVCASGLEVQKQQNVVIVIALAALAIALGIPVDSLSWDSSLTMLSGYTKVFMAVEGGLLVLTVISFFIAAYTRSDREYIFIGIGSLLAFLGRNALLYADAWITLPGLAVLAAGTWFFCTKLHRVYLWL
jgi:hypothetical protein